MISGRHCSAAQQHPVAQMGPRVVQTRVLRVSKAAKLISCTEPPKKDPNTANLQFHKREQDVGKKVLLLAFTILSRNMALYELQLWNL